VELQILRPLNQILGPWTSLLHGYFFDVEAPAISGGMEIRPSMASTIARAPQIKIDKLAEVGKPRIA